MKQKQITLPANVVDILHRLEEHGHEAYVVGGAVRDMLMGQTPKDWDIVTSADLNTAMQCFSPKDVLPGKPGPGTFILKRGGGAYEIATFRRNSADIDQDLAHRDFTINALAYHPQKGILDNSGGQADIEQKRIRCVGKAEDRFAEDGLRIIRALRFSASLGFILEEKTALAAYKTRNSLQSIAAERLRTELEALLCGDNVQQVLEKYGEILAVPLPEIKRMFGFCQYNPHHHLDVWQHTATAVAAVPPDHLLRFTLLFHDAGKPNAFSQDNQGIGHFYGHPRKSAALAKAAMERLGYATEVIDTVTTLILHHDDTIPIRENTVKRWLIRLGNQNFARLLAVKRADATAQHPDFRAERLAQIEALARCAETILQTKQCYQRRDLAVNGHDLTAIGISDGEKTGIILEQLLALVMDGTIPNRPTVLLQTAAILAGEANWQETRV